jgi:hypothetical protein
MAEHEPSIGLSSDWFTPKPIFDALGLVFDLDPAHPGRDNPHCVVPTRRIFTARDDGLRQPWHGLIWLNPPFGGRRGQVPWLRKFLEHCNGIALCAARTSADWFHELVVPNAELLLFPAGKTKFIRPDGSIGKEPGTGIVLVGAFLEQSIDPRSAPSSEMSSAAIEITSPATRRGRPRGDFRKVKITQSPIPECRYFFGFGLMGGATSK